LTAAINLTLKCKTRLKKLATDKRSSLLCCSIGENGKKSYNIVTWNTRDDDNSVGFANYEAKQNKNYKKQLIH